MNILVLNGSPKGKYSVTLQTEIFIEKNFPEHTYETLHVGRQIKAFQKDFSLAKEKLQWADMIIFSYPVYTFLAPSQLHVFVSLMKESGIDFSGKYATQITTSKHFYDVTAHKYIQENVQDMGMKFIRGLAADMDDIVTPKGQKEAKQFFGYALDCIAHDIYEPFPKAYPVFESVPASIPRSECISRSGDVVIVTDCEKDNTQLSAMIERFREKLSYNTRIVNLNDFKFSGGCLGCLKCASSGKCVYKDGFEDFLRNTIQTAQAIVYAFTIKDHSMGTLFKMYDDRQFCNGHRTVTMGTPTGYIISGNYSQENNVRLLVEAKSQVGGNFLAGVATDEAETDRSIDSLAHSLSYALDNHITQPMNFYGDGGRRIFRDLIYVMQGFMREDHKFYKKNGQYDLPHKQVGRIAFMYMAGSMLKNKKMSSVIGNKLSEGMLMPYQKAIGAEPFLMESINKEAQKKKANKK